MERICYKIQSIILDLLIFNTIRGNWITQAMQKKKNHWTNNEKSIWLFSWILPAVLLSLAAFAVLSVKPKCKIRKWRLRCKDLFRLMPRSLCVIFDHFFDLLISLPPPSLALPIVLQAVSVTPSLFLQSFSMWHWSLLFQETILEPPSSTFP